MAFDQAGEQRKFQLQELVKRFHDQKILRKDFQIGQKVLLFNLRLKLIIGKLRSKYDGPFVVTNIFPHGAIQLKNEHTNSIFQVNGHQVKPFHEGPAPATDDMESSTDPLYDLDPEIELTFHRLRKARNIVVSDFSNSVSNSPVTNISDSIEYSSTNSFAE
ncbi:hypothetical protein CR513_36370, partial [Mucuna pruriens]